MVVLLHSCVQLEPVNKSVDGVWQQVGYGRYYEISQDSIREYLYSKVGCHLYETYDSIRISKLNIDDQGRLHWEKGINTYYYTRVYKLPDACNIGEEERNDPVHNFDVLWNTFDEHYAFFKQRNIEWDDIYQQYRPQISEQTSQVELYNIIKEILDSISDSHIEFSIPESIATDIKRLNSDKTKKRKVGTVQWINLAGEIIEKNMETFKSYNAGVFRYGKIDNIGYIQSNSMMLMADYGIDQSLSLREYFGKYMELSELSEDDHQDEVEGTHKLMQKALNEMGDVDGYIIDWRFNGGGKDKVGMTMLSYFVDKKIIGGTKKAVSNRGYTIPQEIAIMPNENSIYKPVIVLSSSESASATEVALLCAQNMDNVTIIGSATEGIFSDMLDNTLPNGWEYSMSNEVYENKDGVNYENIGIPPDIEMDYPRDGVELYDLLLSENETKDLAINKALEVLNEK